MRWSLVLVALVACANKRNADVCCETEDECAAIDFDSPQPCELGVCVAHVCQDSGCDGPEDCDQARCFQGACLSDAALCEQTGGQIVFDSDRNGGGDIFVTLGDGFAKALTTGPDLESKPVPSPQRDKIAYLREGSSARDIFVMEADGSAALNATDGSEMDAEVVWAPDATWLAVATMEGTVYAVQSIGSAHSAAVGLPNAANSDPSWAPDSMTISYVSQSATEGVIYRALLDGTSRVEIRRLQGAPFSRPRWAPNGATLAYIERGDIILTNSDGVDGVPLTHTLQDVTDLVWSHDGSMLAYVRAHSGREDVWVMNADGTNPVSITFDAGRNERPRWSPDDKYLVFDSDRDGQWEIYRAARDGSQLINVSMNPADDHNGDWIDCPR